MAEQDSALPAVAAMEAPEAVHPQLPDNLTAKALLWIYWADPAAVALQEKPAAAAAVH